MILNSKFDIFKDQNNYDLMFITALSMSPNNIVKNDVVTVSWVWTLFATLATMSWVNFSRSNWLSLANPVSS